MAVRGVDWKDMPDLANVVVLELGDMVIKQDSLMLLEQIITLHEKRARWDLGLISTDHLCLLEDIKIRIKYIKENTIEYT